MVVADGGRKGSEMRKAVPLLPTRVLVRLRILPPWRSTIALVMANPNPVPLPFFVLKKASNILSRTAEGIP